MKATKLIPAVCLFLAALPAPAAQKEGYNIYLTAAAEEDVPLKEPADSFACRDKIYAVVEVDRPDDSGNHVLQAVWRNPAGNDQEVTEYPFSLINGSAHIWLWLKLRGNSAFRIFNPGAGMEEFAGDWEILLKVDGELVGRKKFEVIC